MSQEEYLNLLKEYKAMVIKEGDAYIAERIWKGSSRQSDVAWKELRGRYASVDRVIDYPIVSCSVQDNNSNSYSTRRRHI